MTHLKISRPGGRTEFRFALEGVVDPAGARSLDRLLLECQGRGAREVRLDFAKVESICALGLSVLARWGRVYEETDRRIMVSGLSPAIRAPLASVQAVYYESNEAPAAGDVAAAVAVEAATAPAGAQAAPAPQPPPTRAPAAPVPPAPEIAEAELAAVQGKLRRKVVEFRNLLEVTQGLNLAPDLEEVERLMSLHVMGQFGVARLALFLTDPEREGTISPRHVRGFAADHFRDFAVPVTAFQPLPPECAIFPLPDLARVGEGAEGLEALLQSGFDWGVVLRVRGDLVGALFLGGRANEREFGEDERDLLTLLANQAAIAIANARSQRALEERNLGLVRGMMALIESRDVYAKGSTERVVRYVTAVAKLLNVPKAPLKSLIYGAVLRDIGMITVSHLIVKNPAQLSEEEWALIKQHPVRGAQILEEMNLPKDVIDVVQNHHERWCGEGYPSGIRGAEIPLGARIVSLVDAYVAMTSERPYRRALPSDKARQVIAENWGTPFDPSIVEAFLAVLDRLEKRTRQRLARVADAGGAGSAEGPGAGGAAAAVPEGGPTIPAEAALDPLAAGATIPVEVKP